MDQYVRWLELDEDQETLARAIWTDWRTRYMTEFLQSAQQHTSNQLLPGQEAYEEMVRERRVEDAEIRAEWEQRIEELFTDLEAILREDQVPRMIRVRRGWQRYLWRASRSELPEANVDLIELVEGIQLSAEERAAVEEVIAESDPQFIEALRTSYLAREQAMPLAMRWDRLYQKLTLGMHDQSLEAEELSALEEESSELWRKRKRMTHGPRHRLLAVNRQGLARFLEVLSEENAAELKRRYLELSYPYIYPDPASAEVLYDLVESFEDLDEGQRAAVGVARRNFERRHTQLSEDMSEARMISRGGGDLELDQFKGMELQYDHRQKSIDLGREREELNEAQIHILKAYLTPEQFERLPEWDFEKTLPPAPWDPDAERAREYQRKHRVRPGQEPDAEPQD